MKISSQRGVTLLEVVVSISIMMMGLIGMSQIADRYSADVTNSVAADQQKRIAEAARNYIKDNFSTIAGTATTTAPYLITTSMLVTGGYLPTGTPTTNGYSQNTCTLVLQPTANKLQGLVVTEGGTTIDDITLGSIVGLIGSSAGSVQSTNSANITGAMGGWSIPVASYSNLVNNLGKKCDGTTAGNVIIATGHTAVALWFENSFAQSSTLYRSAVPGMPQLNTVNTPIIFNATQTVGSACTTAGALANDAAGAVINCTAGQWKSIGGSGSPYWADAVANYASLPACNAGSTAATRVVTTPTVGSGPRAYTCDGATWKALSVDDSGNLNIAGILSAAKITPTTVVTAGAACTDTSGTIAKDSNGQILSCQSGVWKLNGQGTSISGWLKPFAGMSLYCQNGSAQTKGWATVDANGVPSVMGSLYGVSTGWITGTIVTRIISEGTVDLVMDLGGVSVRTTDNYGSVDSCRANWPMS